MGEPSPTAKLLAFIATCQAEGLTQEQILDRIVSQAEEPVDELERRSRNSILMHDAYVAWIQAPGDD